jgi:GNAT superfamily N-acetyltransferase
VQALTHPHSFSSPSAELEDLPQLVELLAELFREEADFQPDARKQEHGLKLILEAPQRGRIFVIRTDHRILGMINLLFTISTAEGGTVLLMEDVVIHPQHRRQGFGSQLVEHAKDYAVKRGFKRITLLTDRISADSQEFFARHGFTMSSMVPMRLVLS